MRILNKYVLKNIVTVYLFILLVFIGLYLLIDIFSTMSDMLKAKTPLHTLVAYYFFMLPAIFMRVGPFSLLISTLYVFGEMNKTNEITSMRACGVSTRHLCAPVICFALALSVLSFFMQEKVLMESQKKVEEIKTRFIHKDNKDNEFSNFAFPYNNFIFFAQKFRPKEGYMENVTIFEEDDKDNIIKKTVCRRLIYQPANWKGREVIEYNLDPEGNIFGKPVESLEKEIKLSGLPQDIISRRTIFNQYASLRTLRKDRKRLKKVGDSTLYSNKTIDYHSKIAEPFSHFFMLFAAIPFAAQIRKRKAALSSLSTGFIFGFSYYCLSAFSIALAKSAILFPILGPWLAPLFFVVMGITGFYMLR